MSSAVSLISCERSSDESTFQDEFVPAGEFLQGGVERWLQQPRLQRHPQLFAPHSLKVGVFGVIGHDPVKRCGCELAPLLARQSHPRICCFEDDEIEGCRKLIRSRRGKSAVAGEDTEVCSERRCRQERGEGRDRIADRKRRALRLPFRRTPLARWRPQIEENAAPQRTLRRYVADDIAIHGGGGDRPIEHELNLRLIPWRDRSDFEQDNPRTHFRRAVVEMDRKPLADRFLFAGQEAQNRVDAFRRRVEVGVEHDITASNRILLDARTCEVERAAVASLRGFGSPVLRMQGSNARHQPTWADLNPLADTHRSGIDRPRGHHANAQQREDPVDRQTKPHSLRSIAHDAARRLEMGAQRINPLPARRRDSKHARVRESRPADHRLRVARDLREPLMRGEIRFRKHDNAAVDAQQVEYRHMLERLGFYSVIGGHRQDRVIDPGRAREHRMDEALVARNVDEAERRSRRRGQEGETEVDGDAARLLFLEAIAIHAGQQPDQSRFPMVDMPGQPDDHGCPRGSDRRTSFNVVASSLRCSRLDWKAASSVRQRKSSTSRSFSIRPITGVGNERSLSAKSSIARPLPEARMERPALSIVSRGSAPDPIWLRHSESSTANASPTARAT